MGFISVFRETTSCLSQPEPHAAGYTGVQPNGLNFCIFFLLSCQQPLPTYSHNSSLLSFGNLPPPCHMGLLGLLITGLTFSGQRVGSLGCRDGFIVWECHLLKSIRLFWDFGSSIGREELTLTEIGWCKLEPVCDHICSLPWVSHKTTWRKLICSRKEPNIPKLRNGHRETQNDMESLHPVMPEIISIPGTFISGVNKYSFCWNWLDFSFSCFQLRVLAKTYFITQRFPYSRLVLLAFLTLTFTNGNKWRMCVKI